MPAVLTESSTVKCADQGTVQLRAGQSKLTVNGSKVLVDGDLAGASLGLCTLATTNTTKTCSAVALVLPGGVAGKLKVDGKGVLLESIKGTTDGFIPAGPRTWSVQSAGQTKLTTT